MLRITSPVLLIGLVLVMAALWFIFRNEGKSITIAGKGSLINYYVTLVVQMNHHSLCSVEPNLFFCRQRDWSQGTGDICVSHCYSSLPLWWSHLCYILDHWYV